jgi:hypothetical protein
LTGLFLLLVAVLPGSMYVWAFERQASAFGVTLADRILRFVAISVLFHLALGWVEYALFRSVLVNEAFSWGQFASAWGVALMGVVVPAGLGTVVGGLYATRSTRAGWQWLRARLSPNKEHRLLNVLIGRAPAPRAWDDLFSDRPTVYLRVRTTGGEWVAGKFADESYTGGFPFDTDLFLEEAVGVSTDGALTGLPLGYAVYLPASQIAWVDVVPDEFQSEGVGPHGATAAKS